MELTCKLHVKLVFWLKNLDVKRAIWSKVLGSPSPEYGLMILQGKEEQKQHFNDEAAVDSNLDFVDHEVCPADTLIDRVLQ